MTTPAEPRGPVPDADPLDELASAIVDGEATEAERARAAEPDVAARVAAFEAVARRVAAPLDAPSDADRDRSVAAALAAADAVPTGDTADVLQLTSAPRAARRRRTPTWLPAAAAAAVAIAGLGLLIGALGQASDSDDLASDAASEGTVEESATFQESADAGTGGPATTIPAGAPAPGTNASGSFVPDLGELDDESDLAVALRAATSPPPPAATTVIVADEDAGGDDGAAAGEDTEAATEGESGAATADRLGQSGVPCADDLGTSLVGLFTARLDGRPVTVGLFDDAGARSYVVLDQATCDTVATADL